MVVAEQDTATPLAFYGWIMEESGYEVYLGKPDALDFEELAVVYSKNKEGRPLIRIVMSFAEDMVKALMKQANKPFEPRPGTNLQMLVKLPFKVNPVHLNQLKILAAHINQLIPAGSFLVTEVDGVTYRYNYMGINQRDIEPRLFVRMVSQTGYLAKRYLPKFGVLNKGSKSLENILAELEGNS